MEWDKPPRGPHQGPGNIKDLEEALARIRARLDAYQTFKGPFWAAAIVLGVALFILVNSYYMVEPQESAVVLRFGKLVRTAEAGLHFKIPFGIETVRKVVTGRVLQHEYGYRTVQPGVRSRFSEKGFEEESRMLSGDLNVVDLQWTLQYKIRNPVDYLFRVDNVEATLDDMSESVVRRIVGNRYADEVLTVGRASIADMAKEEIQRILDQYSTGLEIVTVKLQNANPPEAVRAAFNEVNEARQEKERMINEAQEAYNQRIPRASGEARQLVTQAEGYALERVNRAEGEVQRFRDILAEYEKAPEITRRRMYLESMGELLGRVDRLFVLDEKQQNLLPLFDLNNSMEAREREPQPGRQGAAPPSPKVGQSAAGGNR